MIGEKQLAHNRAEVLFSNYYTKEPDRGIMEIIEDLKEKPLLAAFYHGFIDDSGTKFIGFFADINTRNFQEMRTMNDMDVQIITDNMLDFDKVPNIYAHVVVGVQYNSKWYIKKDKVPTLM
jgi:hypothetical protein